MYTRIESRFWNDEKMRNVSPEARYLMLYLLTSPHRNILGFYFLPEPYACFDLGWTPEQFKKRLHELLEKGLVKYDENSHVILIMNFLKHNPLENHNQVKSAIQRLNEIPRTPLLRDLYEVIKEHSNNKKHYSLLLEQLEELLQKPFTQQFPKPLEQPFSKQEKEEEKEEEKEKENKYICSSADADVCVSLLPEENTTEMAPIQTQPSQRKEEDEHSLNDHGKLTECSLNAHEQLNKHSCQDMLPSLADAIMAAYAADDKPLTEGKQQGKSKKEEYTPEFEEFWAHYPRKIEKKRAFRVWKTRLREGVPPEVLIQACKHYAEYCARQGSEQRYIKHPSTFLGPDRPYEEFIDGVPVQEMRRNKSWGALRRLYDTRKKPQDPDQEIIGEVLSVD